jgi:CheY-like chemotaxis protein
MAKILCIDDDPAEQQLFENVFKKHEFEVSFAKNGQEGLDKAKTFHPNIIVLDVILPTLSGIEVLDALKSNPETKSIPVVIVSNLNDEKNIESALSKGAAKYIVKFECDMDQRAEIIKQLLQKS